MRRIRKYPVYVSLLYTETPSNGNDFAIYKRHTFWYKSEYLFLLAAEWGIWDILSDAVIEGINVNFKHHSRTALDSAMRFRGNDNIIQLLLDAGADANSMDFSSMIELFGARSMQTIKVVTPYLTHSSLCIALDIARSNDRNRIAKYLLQTIKNK